MLYFAQNLKRYRTIKNLTQEDVADYLGITPQSVSKWERSECYPDITLLPALANIFETSIGITVNLFGRIYQEFAGDYCLTERISQVQASEETVASALHQFPRVETVIFDNELTFTHALELYRFMMDSYEELTAAIKAQGIGFVNFLRRFVEERGTVTLHMREHKIVYILESLS